MCSLCLLSKTVLRSRRTWECIHVLHRKHYHRKLTEDYYKLAKAIQHLNSTVFFPDAGGKAKYRDRGQRAPVELLQIGESQIRRGNHIQMSVYLKTWTHKSACSSLCHSRRADCLPCLWAQRAPDVCYQAFPGSGLFGLHIPTQQEMRLFFLGCTITAQVPRTDTPARKFFLYFYFYFIFSKAHFLSSVLVGILGRWAVTF